jgi:hypothetical protein
MTRPPFIVMGTPRSRTAWLARLLSCGDVTCEHEPSVRWTSRADLWRFLDQDNVGASDASLTWFWRDIIAFRPDCRIVVVRRPLAEVRASCRRAAIPLAEPDGLDALDAEAAAVRGRNVTKAAFADLGRAAVVGEVFRWCLGEAPPFGWVDRLQRINIQADIPARLAEGSANLPGFTRLMSERGARAPGRREGA